MKKSLVCLVFFSCLLTICVRADDKPRHVFSHEIRLDFVRGGDEEIFSDVMGYGFFSPVVSVSAGLKNTAGIISSSVMTDYMPLRIPGFSLGIRGGYNMNLMIDCCVENNLVFGSAICAGNKDTVSVIFDCAYLLKLTDFYKLHNTLPLLIDHTAALSLSVRAALSDRFLLGVGIASYDVFYYPLFFNPRYELEGSVLLNPHFRLKGLLSVQYSDMFTLTAYPARISMGLCMECKIMESGGR